MPMKGAPLGGVTPAQFVSIRNSSAYMEAGSNAGLRWKNTKLATWPDVMSPPRLVVRVVAGAEPVPNVAGSGLTHILTESSLVAPVLKV